MTDDPSPLQGVIGLLGAFALSNGEAVRERVVDSAAESFRAEVVGIVVGGRVLASVGLSPAASAEPLLVAAAEANGGTAPFDSLGELHVAALPIGRGEDRFVVARSGGPFDPEELRAGRAMVRVMRLAVRTLEALDEQREAATRLEAEVARNRELADELQRRHGNLMSRMLDIQSKLSSSAGSVMGAIEAQGGPLFDGASVAVRLLGPDGRLRSRPGAAVKRSAPPDLDRAVAMRAIERNRLVIGDASSGLGTVCLAAPIHQRDHAIGAVTVTTDRPDHQFSRTDQETLLLLAGYGSVALGDAAIIEERQEALEEAEWQATHDPLTGLANRRLVLDTVDRRMAADEDVVVLYIDVDRFKSVNDLYGHQVGDEFIRGLAARLSSAIRPGDLAGRLAGDEFIVVCGVGTADEVQMQAMAERLGRELSESIEVNERSISLTVSIGLATSEGLGSAAELINAADVAMYQAKSGGRNRTGLFDEELQQRIRRRAALAERLEAAAATGQGLHLEYQPIVDLETGAVRGHEALLRLVDPVLGSIEPDEFIAQAEELGVIAEIDNWVLRTALREAAAAGIRTRLSVNVSPAWLISTDAADLVSETSQATGFPLDRLALEVTERVALADNVTETLHRLREVGVKILLDDFGTGYSSLAYVRTLEIDGIKIDRGFLEGVEHDRHRAAILEAVVTLTERLDAMAIAEGVESASQAQLLRTFGCHMAQGFYYGRPAPAPEGLLPREGQRRVVTGSAIRPSP